MESPIQQLIDILTTSPSVELLRSKNRVPILTFFVETFTEDHKVQGQEVLFQRLSDFIGKKVRQLLRCFLMKRRNTIYAIG